MAHLVSSSTILAYPTNINEKHKSTSTRPSKKLANDNLYWREIRHIKPTCKMQMNCWHGIMLDLLTVVYVQYVIMLIDL